MYPTPRVGQKDFKASKEKLVVERVVTFENRKVIDNIRAENHKRIKIDKILKDSLADNSKVGYRFQQRVHSREKDSHEMLK